MRVVSIVGARPQYIKLAPLHRELTRHNIDHLIINTGQHYDRQLAKVFFDQLDLPRPTADLRVGSADASVMVAAILDRAAKALRRLAPDLVIVYGDTNSTLGGALATAQANIPLAHVEAGLRCFDLSVPEEFNRVVTDRISTWHFCPTPRARLNLAKEGISRSVYLTGDILYDVLNAAMPSAAESKSVLEEYGVTRRSYSLLTCHRAETVDDPVRLQRLISMLECIAEPVIFPIHPHTRKRLQRFGLRRRLSRLANINVVSPCGYRQSLALIAAARRVLTDSGGVQREAYYLKVPTLILREVTEWVEIREARGSLLVGFDQQALARGLSSYPFRFRNRTICRIGASTRIARLLSRRI